MFIKGNGRENQPGRETDIYCQTSYFEHVNSIHKTLKDIRKQQKRIFCLSKKKVVNRSRNCTMRDKQMHIYMYGCVIAVISDMYRDTHIN